MSQSRLVSLAAGVLPELAADPAALVATAAAAGWPGTGIWFDPASWTDSTTRQVKQRLDDTGLVPLDMEVVRIGRRDHGERLVDAAVELGVRNVLAVSMATDPAQTAGRLATLCRRAAPGGIRVCIEFMRFTTTKTLADAIAVVAAADEPNVGILVDLLHVHRSGTTYDEIRVADAGLFPYAQWCDGAAAPAGWDDEDLFREALDERTIPGRGGLDAIGFQYLFDVAVPFSIEVRSRALRDTHPDPVERAAHVLAGTRAALRRP